MAQLIERASWSADPSGWDGELEGIACGAGVSLIFVHLPEIGGGPRLHRHPYPETFIVRAGRGLFTVGDRELVAEAGQILVVPPLTPHKFRNLGPGALETTDVHACDRFVTEWLE